MHTIKSRKLLMLKPSQIKIPTFKLRKDIDVGELKKLSQSIAVNGIIEPISVRKNKAGFYELIFGERRLRGAVMAGLRRVPCVLCETDDTQCMFYGIIENLQRQAPDPFYEAQILNRLIAQHSLSHNQVALSVGISLAELSYKLKLLELDGELIEKIRLSGLEEDYARLLLLLPIYKRKEVLEKIITERLSIEETKKVINLKLNPPPPCVCEEPKAEPIVEESPPPVRKRSIGDVRLFANSLTKLTDTLKSAGIKVNLRRTENDKYIEYKVRINKESAEQGEYKQLKIC